MRHQVRRAEVRLNRPFHGLAVTQAGIVPRERDIVDRLAGYRTERPLDTERAQHLDRIRAELDARTDLAELRGAFVNGNFDPVLAQRTGRGKSAEPCANDCHADV